jgi:hypothetical protein
MVCAAGFVLAAGIAWAFNFAWGEHSYHSYCWSCGDNIWWGSAEEGPINWDKHLTYNGEYGTLPCPPMCDSPL